MGIWEVLHGYLDYKVKERERVVQETMESRKLQKVTASKKFPVMETG